MFNTYHCGKIREREGKWVADMVDLFIMMVERLGLIILMAYILVQTRLFKRVFYRRRDLSTQLILVAIFAVFALMSNLNGVEVQAGSVVYRPILTKLAPASSMANTRALTIGISGIIGGPLVGVSVGGISGIVRYFQGGLGPTCLPHLFSIDWSGIRSAGPGLYPEAADTYRSIRWPGCRSFWAGSNGSYLNCQLKARPGFSLGPVYHFADDND